MAIEKRPEALARAVELREAGPLLASGHRMPAVGFGTSGLAPGIDTEEAIKCAMIHGYRHFDCAAKYGNEISVGVALKNSGIEREEFFITSKVWLDSMTYEGTIESCHRSIRDLKCQYLDLYLIHWPASPYKQPNWRDINLNVWRAMCDLYKEGLVKSIGVSNCKELHLDDLLKSEIPPMVNQLEVHPGHAQRSLLKFSQDRNMVIQGWSPLGRSKVVRNEVVIEMARKYGRTPAQICLRYDWQLGVVPLPKAVNIDHVITNLNFLNFEISDEDMEVLHKLENAQVGFSYEDPDM